ncbi:hypothetical protein BDE02_02G235500 [Populus trichocarpa]|nr:hypothetical protein BDE02_02G235500 [Populus trichocarpa]
MRSKEKETWNVQGCHHSKLQHLPERLLSNWKAISPASQKKLCKAMESGDLGDEDYYKYARKLCYRNLNENKIGRLGRAYQNRIFDLTISPERIIRKLKSEEYGFHYKDILKKQMRDIESITTKLTKEVNSVKDIVQETWQSKVYPAMPLKHRADEVNSKCN